jgi:hypothetical protein
MFTQGLRRSPRFKRQYTGVVGSAEHCNRARTYSHSQRVVFIIDQLIDQCIDRCADFAYIVD